MEPAAEKSVEASKVVCKLQSLWTDKTDMRVGPSAKSSGNWVDAESESWEKLYRCKLLFLSRFC